LDCFSNQTELPFVTVLKKILKFKNIDRIRISSLEPAEFTPDLAELMGSSQVFCDHLHLPLQSGSDRILKLMNRQYSKAGYMQAIERANEIFKKPFLGCDVIPGFPGETDQDFKETIKFIEDCGLTALHVFPYSKRPNTAAAKMPAHLDQSIVKERAQILREISEKSLSKFYIEHIDSEMTVLWEGDKDSSGRILGKTTNYLNIASPEKSDLKKGMITRVKIKGLLGKQKLLGISI